MPSQLRRAHWSPRGDRRSWRLSLTAKGRKAFEAIASEHERWVIDLFGGIDDADRQALYALLGKLRVHLSAPPQTPTETPTP